MDTGLYAQEMIAGNLDMSGGFDVGLFPTYKAGEATGGYSIYTSPQPNWTVCSMELNQTYKDPQYAELFSIPDFRHAMSIAVDRNEMNEILYAGLAVPAQAAAPEGTAEYIDGARENGPSMTPLPRTPCWMGSR